MDVHSAAEVVGFLDSIPDGTPVKVRGVITEIPVVGLNAPAGGAFANLNLLAPQPLSFQKLSELKLRCKLVSPQELDGLAEEREVELVGVADTRGRGRGLRECRVVSRGAVPNHAPAAVDLVRVQGGNSPAPPDSPGVDFDRASASLTFAENAVTADGAIPPVAIEFVKGDHGFANVVVRAPISSKSLAVIGSMEGLKSLQLFGQSGEHSLDLSLLADHQRLRYLELHVDRLPSDNLIQLARFQCAAALTVEAASLFDGCDLSGIDDATLRALAQLKSLRFISLGAKRKGKATQITDDGLKALAELPRLTALDIWSESFTGAGFSALGGAENLWSLRVAKCSVTSAGLAGLSEVHSLQVLDLSGTQVDSAIGASLSTLSNLAMVNVANTKVDDRFAAHLAGHAELRVLDLRGNAGVTDASLQSLVENPPPRLQTLQLDRTQITDGGLRELSAIRTLRLLTASELSEEVKAVLKRNNPELSVY
ncbi:MAG: hypothetical protein QGG36_33075 [Pirellulaceae bacterium]|nr:hypothetical protein [Pirellulaceae bacterium]